MALPVVDGATLKCTMGTSTCSLTVLPTNSVQMEDAYAANIMDYIPMTNISGFGNCTTVSNPVVASATSAALGVLTPQACVPALVAPWVPGSSTVMIGNMPALNNSSTCICTWGGTVSVTDAGVTTETIA
jgi:hypothetical protein